MPIVVQKFGGTSVADAERIRNAAARALRTQAAGKHVVLVVSAMGHETDRLVDLARQVSPKPPRRELDMLLSTGEQVSIALVAMAIHEAGGSAISFTGGQVGMVTDSEHTRARIHSIDAERIEAALRDGQIAIVAGFQGIDAERNITTLGRGGSDTTAVALAAALQAETCEILTDVDGIYTTDPRIVEQARKLERISYDEMLEMASLGAGVMHGRAIELGKKYGVPIHVRSSFTDKPGTIIMAATPGMEEVAVQGATLKRGITRVTLAGLPNQPGITAAIFEEIARRGLFVDDIIQNVVLTGSHADHAERATLGFTVEGAEEHEIREAVEQLRSSFDLSDADVNPQLARVSVIGVGMRSHRGVAATMFQALAGARVNIENIATSEIVISVLVSTDDAETALRAVHEAFALGDAPAP